MTITFMAILQDRKDSSFSEEKEAKRLYPFAPGVPVERRAQSSSYRRGIFRAFT
jgi:hypothetical protein